MTRTLPSISDQEIDIPGFCPSQWSAGQQRRGITVYLSTKFCSIRKNDPAPLSFDESLWITVRKSYLTSELVSFFLPIFWLRNKKTGYTLPLDGLPQSENVAPSFLTTSVPRTQTLPLTILRHCGRRVL
ncbi:hypothetical protein AHF37_12091 [Paragonimus kellicotti]|nr:hypothetical protein AHF37_12091 [Paragonimus kellicotti]